MVVIHSGGLDSTTLLYHMRHHLRTRSGRPGPELYSLSVDYGQRHRRELDAAGQICGDLGIPHRVADLRSLRPFLAGSSQTGDVPVPHGHYADETMRATVVPNRNMILLAVAIGWAVSLGSHDVAYGAHAGDHAIYPDCRPAFVDAMTAVARVCHYEPGVRLHAPFLEWTKTDIVRRGALLGVPFADTWSCYEGGALHCGRCGTCTERREAFALAGLLDPTTYEGGS